MTCHPRHILGETIDQSYQSSCYQQKRSSYALHYTNDAVYEQELLKTIA